MIKLKDLANIIYDDFVSITIFDGGNRIPTTLEEIKTNKCSFNERYVYYFDFDPYIGGIGNTIYIDMNVRLYDESVKGDIEL